MRRLLLLSASLVTLAAWSAGCEAKPENEEENSPDSITVGPANPTIEVGQTQQLTVTGLFPDESTDDVTDLASFVSATSAIATVSADGLVTGLAVGTVTISANYDFRTDATMVTVVATSGGGNFVEIEPNNDFPEANDAGLADTFSGQCNEIDDFIDFYVTSAGPVVVGTGVLAFTLTWDEGTTFEDIDLVLVDTAGGLVDADQTIPNAMTPDSPAEAFAVITTARTIFFVVDCYVTVPTTYTGTITRP